MMHSKSFIDNDFLLKDEKLCVHICFLRELLIYKAHDRGLMRQFGIVKTVDILHKHFIT